MIRDGIAMTISDAVYARYGYGPSMNLCLTMADQVIAEADEFKFPLRGDR